MPETWKVFRHNGRDGTDWREVFSGTEEKARERYGKVVEALRQGGVRLRTPEGVNTSSVWAPRLRSRW